MVVLAVLSAVLFGHRAGVVEALLGIRWWGIAGALVLAVVSVSAEGLALAILRGNVTRHSVRAMTRAYVTGGFAGSVTPYALGGLPGWLWAFSREGVSAGEGAALVTGRAVAVQGFFMIMALLGALIAPSLGMPVAAVLASVASVFCITLLAVTLRDPERIERTASTLLDRLSTKPHPAWVGRALAKAPGEVGRFASVLRMLVTRRPARLFGALAAIGVARLSQLAAIPLLFAAQGHTLSSGQAIPRLVAVWVVSSLIPAPGGEGVGQAAVVAIFGPLMTQRSAIATALSWRATVYYPVFFIGGVLFAGLLRSSILSGTAATAPAEHDASVPQ